MTVDPHLCSTPLTANLDNPVQPMVRHRQTDPEEQRWDQGYGQQRGPVRETGRYDAYCGRCGSPLSGFSNACDNCGQHRVERQQFASPAPVSSTPEPAAALTPAQQLLKIQEDKFDFEMRQKFANAAYQAAMNGPAPAKTAKAPVQQQRQRSTQPSRRQQNNRGRQPTPFRGSGFRYQPRSSQWVAPGYRQAHYVPVQRSGPCEPKIEKKVSQTRSRQANDMRQDQVLRGLGGLFEQRATPLQPQQQEKAEDLGDEGLIKEEPQDAAFDRPIKKERTDSGDEHE